MGHEHCSPVLSAMGKLTICSTGAIKDKEFIVNGHFTAADVMIGSTIMWGTKLMPVMPQLTELTEYWGRLEQRDAWQRSFGEDQALMES